MQFARIALNTHAKMHDSASNTYLMMGCYLVKIIEFVATGPDWNGCCSYILVMRVGIPVLRDRISPVFDVSERLALMDVEGGRVLRRTEVAMEKAGHVARAEFIAKLGVQVLICGAISRPLEAMLISAGVRVIPNTCGVVEEILDAFVCDQLTEQAFLMPGCQGRRRRFRHRGGRGGPRR